MRGLIIREPWITKILRGEKTWEIRGSAAKVRGPVALIRGGSGTVVGVCEIAGCLGPLSDAELQSNLSKHHAPVETIRKFGYDKAYAWVLDKVRPLQPPVPYKHPSGAVIWVTLDDSVSRAIAEA